MEAINHVGRAKKIIMALNEPVSYWTDKRREHGHAAYGGSVANSAKG